jgi:hypothetical protein
MSTEHRAANGRGRDPEPRPPTESGPYEYVYNGRGFYGDHASDRAELTYLRDWKAWAERRLRGLNALADSVTEALNSGDGSYRP